MPSIRAKASASPLLGSLRQRIAERGPVTVYDYMRCCLEDPNHGYWQRRETIGRGGDFVTAPEISQVFGELIGLWSIIAWQRLGKPRPVRLVELGPGRGTLMRDALRAARIAPDFLTAATVHLVEISAELREVQRQSIASLHSETTWHEDLDETPTGPSIIIGNEFLDALPVHQLIAGEDGWRERVVGIGPEGVLRFEIGPLVDFQSSDTPPAGSIVELRPDEDALLDSLARRRDPYIALFIDYGPAAATYGDTLQAVRRHAYADPLLEPGTADLTAHVQFGRLAQNAKARGLVAYGPLAQADFLGRLGIVERAQRLMSANPARAGEIEGAVQRLISPYGMGSLFKALAIAAPGLPPPEPFG